MGVGKTTERIVNDVDGNGIVVGAYGEPVKYIVMGEKIPGKDRTKTLIEGLGVTKDKDGNYVLGEGLAWITVHDVDVSQVYSADQAGLNEGIKALSEFGDGVKLAATALAIYYNELARDLVSPKAEERPDELGDLVAALIGAGLLTDKSSGVWRRTVTSGADATGMERLDFAGQTKVVKALRALMTIQQLEGYGS